MLQFRLRQYSGFCLENCSRPHAHQCSAKDASSCPESQIVLSICMIPAKLLRQDLSMWLWTVLVADARLWQSSQKQVWADTAHPHSCQRLAYAMQLAEEVLHSHGKRLSSCRLGSEELPGGNCDKL